MVSQPIEALLVLRRTRPIAVRRIRPVDVAFRSLALLCGIFAIGAAVFLLAFLVHAGLRGIVHAGPQLLTGVRWKPEAGVFGGVPLIVGTVTSALGAVLLGALPATLAAVWVTELAPERAQKLFRRAMEIATALPSVVYGWLALEHLVPEVDGVAKLFFAMRPDVGGEGLFTSAILLAVMIAPTVTLLSLDALSRVPKVMREASAALGATKLQTAFRVIVPHAKSGLIIATFFGFARAAGETMAVQMVIGGARQLPETPFSPTTTISTQIVMDMQNARPGTPESDVLYAMALVLLVFSSAVVLTTRAISRRGAAG